jgi:hypothetical protein
MVLPNIRYHFTIFYPLYLYITTRLWSISIYYYQITSIYYIIITSNNTVDIDIYISWFIPRLYGLFNGYIWSMDPTRRRWNDSRAATAPDGLQRAQALARAPAGGVGGGHGETVFLFGGVG